MIDRQFCASYSGNRKAVEPMDIGSKIKRARVQVNLTQEYVAERLGVSRQTISNWESGKTYPDIVSVVKMSDLYDISLDHLLKEEASMSNYLDYLEESTNTVKSKRDLSKLILILTYLGIWTISLASFWLFSRGDALGHTIMFLYGVLPVTTFVVSLLIGRNNYWGRWKWACAAVLGVMYMLADYTTFRAANMIAFGKINMPELEMIVVGAIISLLGMAIGGAVRHLRRTAKADPGTNKD